jgi:hypothetical protein
MRFLFSLACIIMIPLLMAAQQNVSFGLLSFNEPSNWTFADNGSYHTYSTVNNSTNIYCVISIYSSNISSGNAKHDFQNEWKGIVSNHFTVTKNPQPQKNTSASGISYLQDEAVLSNNIVNYFAQLSVFNFNGKVQSVLFLTGNKNSLSQYQADLDRFLSSVKSNNTENLNTNKTSTVAGASSSASKSMGLMHFNHFLFTVPAGWKPTNNGNYMTLTAPLVTADEMLSYILFPSFNDTSFQKAGDDAVKQLASSMGGDAKGFGRGDGSVYEALHMGIYKKGWEYSMGSGKIQVNNTADYSKSMSFDVGVFLAKINGRIERVLYLSKDYRCGSYSTTTAYKKTYESIIDNFFFEMKFDDWEDTNIKQDKLSSAAVSGIWSGISYLGGAIKYDATFFILFDNGQVFYDSKFPKAGLYNLNTLSAAANRPDQWGIYSYQNGSGTMKISSWLTVPFTIKDGKMMVQINGGTRPFSKLPPIDGATLNGSWCFEGSCISFTSDGKFTDNGVIQLLEHLPTTCNVTEPLNGQGSYEIKNNSIFFHYADGLTIQNAISGLNIDNGNLSTSKLFLGWYNDVLEKK